MQQKILRAGGREMKFKNVYISRAYKSAYGLEIPKYRLITDPYLKKIQTKYGLYLTEIQT